MEKQIPQAIRNRAYYQDLLTIVPDAALLIDNNGIILAYNQGTTHTFGYTAEELQGEPLDCLLPNRFKAPHQQHITDYLQNPAPRPMGSALELAARHKQGHEIMVKINLVPVEAQDGLVIAVFARDVTERQQMERALAEKQEQLERLVNAKIAELSDINEALRAEIHERQRLEEQLRQMSLELTHRQELLSGELVSLETYSNAPPSAITAQTFQILPLADSLPQVFAEMVGQYGELLETAVNRKIYKIEHDMSDSLHTLADRLGFLNATPQDVAQLHSTTLKQKTANIPYPKANAYFAEGRLLVLKLMGYLAAHYRSYSLHFLRNAASSEMRLPKNMPDRNINEASHQDTNPTTPSMVEE
jgi:PAS domain S-box-containing protein